MSLVMPTSRRGAALLLVLLVMIVTIPVLAGLARSASLRSMHDRDSARLDQIESIRRSIEAASGPIRAWLRRPAARVALPPDAQTPGLILLDSAWIEEDGAELSVRVTAFDQLGMVASAMLGPQSALGRTASDGVRDAAEALRRSTFAPGLDLIDVTDGERVFPRGPDDAEAIGAVLATHNPPTRSRRNQAPMINVSTAPRALLEPLLRAGGVEAVGPIMATRAEGRVPALPSVTVDRLGVRLVNSSQSWAFRIDVSSGTVRRSWWSVYLRRSSSWECEQRLVIAE